MLLQIGEAFFDYKLGQLNYYKSEQLLQFRATVIKNWGKLYYKLGQLLQIGATIANWGITYIVYARVSK